MINLIFLCTVLYSIFKMYIRHNHIVKGFKVNNNKKRQILLRIIKYVFINTMIINF